MSFISSVLVVADPGRIQEITAAIEPAPYGAEVLVSSGGDDTIDLAQAKKPEVAIITATLELGDAGSLIETLRKMAPRAEIQIVLIGDDTGPIRTALDAIDIAPDRFLTRPLSGKSLRIAVEKSLEVVALVRGTPLRESTPLPTRADVITAPPSAITLPGAKASSGTDPAALQHVDDAPTSATRAAMRARWEALADSITMDPEEDPDVVEAAAREHTPEPEPLPPPIVIQPRKRSAPDSVPPEPWRPGNTDELAVTEASGDYAPAPAREPTLIIRDDPGKPPPAPESVPHIVTRVPTNGEEHPASTSSVTASTSAEPSHGRATTEDRWGEPMPLADLIDRESQRDVVDLSDDVDVVDEVDDDYGEIVVGHGAHASPPGPMTDEPEPPEAPVAEGTDGGRDFARQLRAKMSMMAQRLFQNDSGAQPAVVDVAPRHDHSTEIDLAALADEPMLGGAGVTEIERTRNADMREQLPTTSPGSWDTQVRERGVPDAGEIVRGVSDAAMLVAKMFAQNATGRIGFRRDDVEKVVFFDQGRPVFASSNEPGDRMGELLVREGKITAAQYERCQSVVAASGRRMGEILVDFGYLKRRELLPAVRRHVEDIVYSLFGWDRGHYHVTIEGTPSSERIRLSRHPASLILEGIRRKLDRTSLEKSVGPASTVIEVPDRERLGGIVNVGDLSPEERAALAAFDGQADLTQVARGAGLDVTDVLPLAWGLVVLGLATARRAEADIVEESTALVGETDLAIDRERVRARWQLVTEADYFALLGVRRDATAFEIRRAYQAARRDFAADCFPNDLRRELARELEDIANVLDEAFRVLRDDRLRLTYLANLFE